MKRIVLSLPFFQFLTLLVVLGLGFLTSNVSCSPQQAKTITTIGEGVCQLLEDAGVGSASDGGVDWVTVACPLLDSAGDAGGGTVKVRMERARWAAFKNAGVVAKPAAIDADAAVLSDASRPKPTVDASK